MRSTLSRSCPGAGLSALVHLSTIRSKHPRSGAPALRHGEQSEDDCPDLTTYPRILPPSGLASLCSYAAILLGATGLMSIVTTCAIRPPVSWIVFGISVFFLPGRR